MWYGSCTCFSTFFMLMTRALVGVGSTRRARTTRQVSGPLRRVLRAPRPTRRGQPVHPGPPERQQPQIDAADGGPVALERCGLLSAPAAFHLAFPLVGGRRVDPLTRRAADSPRDPAGRRNRFPKHGDDYHVFLTPKGDCKGLYVAYQTSTSFEVRELRNGKGTLEFDYRIVAKRRGYERARLAEIRGA